MNSDASEASEASERWTLWLQSKKKLGVHDPVIPSETRPTDFKVLSKTDRNLLVSIAQMIVHLNDDIAKRACKLADLSDEGDVVGSVRHVIGDVSTAKHLRNQKQRQVKSQQAAVPLGIIRLVSGVAKDAVASIMNGSMDFMEFIERIDDVLTFGNHSLENHGLQIDRMSWRLSRLKNC